MIIVLPKMIKNIIDIGLKKLVADSDYRLQLNESFKLLTSSFQRLENESSTYGVPLNNFIEDQANLNAWLQNRLFSTYIGYPRIHQEVTQICIGMDNASDTNDFMSDLGSGELTYSESEGSYRQWVNSVQVEKRIVPINIIDQSVDMVNYITEIVKYILRSGRHYLEDLGVSVFTLNVESVNPGEDSLANGTFYYHNVINFDCMVSNKYRVPYDLGADNISPDDVISDQVPPDTDSNDFATVGGDNE